MSTKINEENEIEFEQPLEEEIDEIEIPEGNRRVYADQGDPEITSLHGKFKK